MTVTFAVPGRPVPQGSLSPFVHAQTGRIVTPQKPALLDWRRTVAGHARQAGLRPTDEACCVTITALYRRPASHRLKSGGLSRRAPRHRTQTPDIDKVCRAVLDALTGVAWHSDAQVVALQAVKAWGGDDRVTITIAIIDGREAA